jgi:CRISPR-associated Csx14 family protein
MPDRRGNHQSNATLIATLGTEPQVVTAFVDLLIRQGINVDSLHIFHTTGGDVRIDQALEILRLEFSHSHSRIFQVHFHAICNASGNSYPDIDTPESVEAFFRLLYLHIWQEKQANHVVQFCIAGGRKTMSVYGMSAAQLLFDERDRLWHLFSAGTFLESKRLHPQPGDDVRLVSIPVIPWSSLSPMFTYLSNIQDPYAAIDQVARLRLRERYDEARIFVLSLLTPAEQRVVRLLALEGLSDQEIADRLVVSPRTVEQQLRAAYTKAEEHWQVGKITRTQLIALLQYFFSTQIGENPHDKPMRSS